MLSDQGIFNFRAVPDPCLRIYLFFVFEPLFVQVRENSDIRGTIIDNYELKLSAYADDADFFTSDVDSRQLVFQTCRSLQAFSSLKLNLEKSEACWIANKKGSLEQL